MSFLSFINQISELETRLSEMKTSLVDDLYQHIKKEPVPGVSMICETPKVVTVNLSNLGSGVILTPEYYISSIQAEAIKNRLENCKTINSICTAVNEMLKEKKVKTGNSIIPLNEITQKIIAESALGKFAIQLRQPKEETE